MVNRLFSKAADYLRRNYWSDEKTKQNTSGTLFLLFAFLIIMIIGRINGDRQLAAIAADPVFTTGLVTDSYMIAHQSSRSFEYVFEIDRNQFKESYPFGYGKDLRFLNRHFPVVYERGNPDNSEMLISKDDFAHYNLPYPDSLLWTEKYRRK